MTGYNGEPRRAARAQRRFLVVLGLVLAGIGGAAFWSSRRPVDYRALRESATLSLRVDISERKLYVERPGEPVRTYDVAVGSPKHPTPRGSYAIGRVIWNPSWVPPDSDWAKDAKAAAPGDPNNPMGRVKMYFREPAYYIHGTNDESSLGRAVSHGCIRMGNDDVIELARLVMEHGGEPRDGGWFEQILERFRSTEEVRLSTPVSIEITD